MKIKLGVAQFLLQSRDVSITGETPAQGTFRIIFKDETPPVQLAAALEWLGQYASRNGLKIRTRGFDRGDDSGAGNAAKSIPRGPAPTAAAAAPFPDPNTALIFK